MVAENEQSDIIQKLRDSISDSLAHLSKAAESVQRDTLKGDLLGISTTLFHLGRKVSDLSKALP